MNTKEIINIKYINYFIFCILFIPLMMYYAKINFEGGNEWLTAEWLINYKYGFVRRGFFGTLLNFADFFSFSKIFLLNTLITLIYIYICYSTLKIFFNKQQNFVSYLLLFSPIFLLFHIYDIKGAFRKELLGIVCYLYILNNLNRNFKSNLVGIFLFTAAIFSSEVNFLILPFIFWVYSLESNGFYSILNKIKYYLLIGFLYIFLFFYFQSTSDNNLSMICSDLLLQGFSKSICSGSIASTSLGIVETFEVYGTTTIFSNKGLTYFIVFILGLFPLFFTPWFYKNLQKILIVFLSFIPFFLISADWGRWIHIYIFCLSVMYFKDENKRYDYLNFYAKALLFYFYVMTWNVNHYEDNLNNFFINLFQSNVLNYLYLINQVF